jgi:tRNA (guanosine-2'-O-)-methyltransferase
MPRRGGGGPKYEAADKIDGANEFLLDSRIERVDAVVSRRTRSLVIVLDRLEDTFNMAAILRTCEGFGLQEIHVIDNDKMAFEPNTRVTQGCDKWLDIHIHKDFRKCLDVLKSRGFSLWASAFSTGARSLYDIRFDSKVALVFGNERFGVASEILEEVDGTFWIPLQGFTQSLNVSAAMSATISYAINWRNQHLGRVGDLTPEDADALRKRFYALSVKQRRRIFGSRVLSARGTVKE